MSDALQALLQLIKANEGINNKARLAPRTPGPGSRPAAGAGEAGEK